MTITKCGEFIQKGGFFVIPILLASLFCMTRFWKLFFYLRKIRTKKTRDNFILLKQYISKEEYEKSTELIKHMSSFLNNIFHPAWNAFLNGSDEMEEILTYCYEREIKMLKGQQQPIAVVAKLSCLLGFMGTVAGMIQIFDVISVRGSVVPQELAGGISEALISTLTGLCVAAISWVAYYIIKGQMDRTVYILEDMVNEYNEVIKKRKNCTEKHRDVE